MKENQESGDEKTEASVQYIMNNIPKMSHCKVCDSKGGKEKRRPEGKMVLPYGKGKLSR